MKCQLLFSTRVKVSELGAIARAASKLPLRRLLALRTSLQTDPCALHIDGAAVTTATGLTGVAAVLILCHQKLAAQNLEGTVTAEGSRREPVKDLIVAGAATSGVPGGRHSIGLRWFAAPELTLARPKAPHVARRALSMSPGEQVRRLGSRSNASSAAEVQMFFGRHSAFETSQLRRWRRRKFWIGLAWKVSGGQK
jgi:hypothetical protein